MITLPRTKHLQSHKATTPRSRRSTSAGMASEEPGRSARAFIASGGGMRRSEEARVSEEVVRRKGGGGGPKELGMG